MARYMGLVKQRVGSFAAWKLEHIPRDSNERADALAVMAASIPINETVSLPIYYQLESSIVTNRVSQIDKTSPSWLTLILHYLSSGELPNNRTEVDPGPGGAIFLGIWVIIQTVFGRTVS